MSNVTIRIISCHVNDGLTAQMKIIPARVPKVPGAKGIRPTKKTVAISFEI
jgi:hypothetical protein